MYIGFHVKYPLFLSDFYQTRIFSKIFEKKKLKHISYKIRLVGAELFHADGQTDMTKLTVTFR